MAARISTVFARHVRYANLPDDRALEELLGSGMAPWDAEGMLELFAWIRAGGAGQLTSHVREVTRHAPRGLTDWLEGSRATFLEPLADGPPPTYYEGLSPWSTGCSAAADARCPRSPSAP